MTNHHHGARSPPPVPAERAKPADDKGQDRAGEAREHDHDEGEMITMSTKKIDAEIEQLQRQLEAAKAEKTAEEQREKIRIAQARKHAGDNHTRAVLELYDLLEIEPEARATRTVRDRDETVRTQRLLDMAAEIVGAADPALLDRLKREDRSGVEDRTPKPRKSPTSAPSPADDDEGGAPADDRHEPSPTPYQSAA